jgi:hypothetical protein
MRLTLGGYSGSFACTVLLLSPSGRPARECWVLLSKALLPMLLILVSSHLRIESCPLHCILRSRLLRKALLSGNLWCSAILAGWWRHSCWYGSRRRHSCWYGRRRLHARPARECWVLLSKALLPMLILVSSHLRIESCPLQCILHSRLLRKALLSRNLWCSAILAGLRRLLKVLLSRRLLLVVLSGGLLVWPLC